MNPGFHIFSCSPVVSGNISLSNYRCPIADEYLFVSVRKLICCLFGEDLFFKKLTSVQYNKFIFYLDKIKMKLYCVVTRKFYSSTKTALVLL